ncbi:unnamed protein product [Adineta steineri]|uniref:NHL repeat containing protein-like protein n=1 Tax=Adineta steineri TaxID=433720 RepID=A0A815CV47_9BILA|nr:unnamed protein product [Adineta steineri]CAF3835148.1 unnamed protein product [Adineta steineri]
MDQSNRISPESVNSDIGETQPTQSTRSCVCIRSKWTWIIFAIVIIASISIPTAILLTKKKNVVKTNLTTIIMKTTGKGSTTSILTTTKNPSTTTTAEPEPITTEGGCTWSKTATTIFGSQAGKAGSNLSFLSQPVGMYYDEPNNMLTILDNQNYRLLQFPITNSPSVATVIAGGKGAGCNMNQFKSPDGIGFDSSGQLYVADYDCSQVVRFPSNSASTTSGTLVGNVSQAALISVDSLTNDVYVASSTANAIYKFVNGSGSRVVAAGGNGKGNASNQLSSPNGVYYDHLYTSSLYVVDSGNNRVLKFPLVSTSATNGTVVAGGNGAGSGANQLKNPRSILVDSNGTLYISDGDNNRVQRWLKNATSGTTIVGGGIAGTASHQLNWPEQILFDRYQNLLVADRQNNRIQRFNITTAC